MWWLIHWFHNATWLFFCESWTSANTFSHQIRQNRPSFLHVLSPSHHTVSIFPSCSIYLLHPLTSPSTPRSEVSFSLRQDSIFSLLFPFPYAYRGDDSARMYKHTHERRMIKSRDVYCAWTDTQGEPNTRAVFFFFRLKLWIASRPEMKTHYIGHFSHSLASRPLHPRVLTVLWHPWFHRNWILSLTPPPPPFFSFPTI